jgi:hypothetical protein
MFVKHSDGKIVSVLDEEELSEEQKKALKDVSKKVVKTSKDKPKKEPNTQGDIS